MNTNDVKSSWAENAERFIDDSAAFQSWFDAASDEREAIANGMVDFFHRIYAPGLHDLLGDIRGATCLEIGVGGGRLLNAACSVFKKAYGIDITSSNVFAKTAEFLQSCGRNNFELLHRDELRSIPERSIKFAYSFIVFQHFASIDEVQFYIDTLDRLLTDDGCGMVFFGLAPEGEDCVQPFDVFLNNPQSSTLLLSPAAMLQQVERKFHVRAHGHAGRKKLWDASRGMSMQYCVLFTR